MSTAATQGLESRSIQNTINDIFLLIKASSIKNENKIVRRVFTTRASAFQISAATYLALGGIMIVAWRYFLPGITVLELTGYLSVIFSQVYLIAWIIVLPIEDFIDWRRQLSQMLPPSYKVAGFSFPERLHVQEIDFIAKRATADYDLYQQLCGFPMEALGYVVARFRLKCQHYRFRMSVLFGALDKVGYLPLVVGSVAQLFLLHLSKNLDLPTWALCITAGVTLYALMGGLAHEIGNRLDELVQLLDLVIGQKEDADA